MTAATFEELERLKTSEGPAAALDRLVDSLRAAKNYDRLFDALLLRKKFAMGLPLARPTSLEDVPPDRRREFEEAYVTAAREIGELFLAENNLPRAWIYLRTIQEPQKVREAIDRLDGRFEPSDDTEQLLQIALYEGAHPVKGLQILLQTHGTCNTVTALDQMIHQMLPDDRRQAAEMMVRELYDDLSQSVRHDVERKLAMVPPGESLRQLIAGRDWLFAEGNYHIDVSHLNAVVRFARFLTPQSAELDKAMQLAEYGSQLAPQYQYPGDPPFEDVYPAHLQFFKVLADRDRDDALGYFRDKLAAEPDEPDKPLLAFVLVDLLVRVGRMDDAVTVAEQYLRDLDPSTGFSFAELCQEAGRMDVLERAARERGDVVAYAAALLAR